MSTNMKETIAVMIPVFNGRKFLEETLKAALSQTYEAIIFIICNDGSSDDSLEIINRVTSANSRKVIILNHENNLGLSDSLIEMYSLAKKFAEIGVILGQDDLIPSDYIQKISRSFKKSDVSIVSTRSICINENSQRIRKTFAPPFVNFLRNEKTAWLLAANHINAPGAAFRITSFDPEFIGSDNPQTQDWRQWIYSSPNSQIKVCLSTNVFYRKHSASLTALGNDFSAHLEISKSRLQFIRSEHFTNYVNNWGYVRKKYFFNTTRILFKEFNNCCHNGEFLQKLSVVLFGEGKGNFSMKVSDKCEGLVGNSDLNQWRKYDAWERSKKQLFPDSYIVNFVFVVVSTLRLLIGRVIRIMNNSFKHFKKTLNQITVFSTGGLGAQLSALSYALWLEEKFNRPIKIHFKEKGLTFFPIVIEDLLTDVPYEIDRWDGEAQADLTEMSKDFQTDKKPGMNSFISLSRGLIKRIMYFFRIVISEEHLSKSALNRVRASTRIVKGYHTDWTIINESWEKLSDRISENRPLNFMSNGGGELSVSIHWRLGDFLNNPQANFTHGTVSANSLISCLKSLNIETPIENIQIFTDSPQIAQEKLISFANEFSFTYISGDIWEDLYKMSRSTIFIGSHSSISTWAAFSILHGNPEAIVFLPNQWFKNSPKGFNRVENTFKNPQEILTNIRGYDAQIS